MSPRVKTYLRHGGLFLLTFVTTTMAGAEWMYGRLFVPIEGQQQLGWSEFLAGMQFSVPFLAILTVHEFGHYVVARINKVRVTLPYYIPFWIGIGQSIGTLGAFIRIRDYIGSRQKYFDIGIAGPLAGFVLALGVLWYGFTHLPPPEFIFSIHPEYQQYGFSYGDYVYRDLPEGAAVALGDNLLFWFFKNYVADPAQLPHPYEMIHLPVILAGYLALFFTSLNLIPIGQLDGGHILYGLIGRERFNYVAPALFVVFAFYAGLGLFKPSDFAVPTDAAFYDQFFKLIFYVFVLYTACQRIGQVPSNPPQRSAYDEYGQPLPGERGPAGPRPPEPGEAANGNSRLTPLLIALSIVAVQFLFSWLQPEWEGYPGFLLFVVVLGRFLGIYHPETDRDVPLDPKRKALGWFALIVFVLCFSPKPFIFS